MQGVIADLLGADLVDVDFPDLARCDPRAVRGIDENDFAGFLRGKKEVEEDFADRGPGVDAENPLRNRVALFQLADDLGAEPVVPDEGVASADHQAVVFIDWPDHSCAKYAIHGGLSRK